MKKKVIILFGFLVVVAPAEGGTIIGTIRAHGKEGTEASASTGGKYDSRQFKFVERVNYEEMHDFIVYIEGAVGPRPTPPEKPLQVITTRNPSVTQKGAMFTPHVLPVVVGTTVEWPNYDDILHNVFSFSEPKPFDLGLYKSPMIERVTFDKPGKVDVFCSIHSRMSCIILVLENPYFATANDKGNYTITNVPPGNYQLRAWHERMPSQVSEITVPETGEIKVDFKLGITNLPKP
jgi:plastocyanin